MWPCPKCGEELPDGIAACWVCGTDPEGVEDPDFVAEEMPEDARASARAAPRQPFGLPAAAPATVRSLWIEVAVVVALVVVPDVWWSIASLVWGVAPVSIAGEYAGLTVRSFCVSVLVLYVIWRSETSWAAFGIDRPRWLRDLGWAVVICVPVYLLNGVAMVAIWELLPDAWHEAWTHEYYEFPRPATGVDWSMFTAGQVSNGIAEELSMRAYLLLRLAQLLGSRFWALLLSSALFASYHAYQGPSGAVSVLIFGVLIGMAFLWCRRLWPVVGAHVLMNCVLAAPL